MDYELSQEQTMIKDAARRLLAKECDGQYLRAMLEDDKGYSQELWQAMAELGWQGLLVPEDCEGFGGSFLDMTVLLYEMGYHCLPGPFFATAVLGVLTLCQAGSNSQQQAVLPEVATGQHLMTLAWQEDHGRFGPAQIKMSAQPDGGQWVLSGSKLWVPDAQVADIIFVAARSTDDSDDPTTGISLFMVEASAPGLSIMQHRTFTGEKLCEVTFDQVRVNGDALLGQADQAWPVLRNVLAQAAVGRCAEMSGGAQKVLETAVAHAKQREQFGRPIGAFQAIQHHCADMLIEADTSGLITHLAAWRISSGLPYLKEASMAKSHVSESYQRLLDLGHQILGGTGFMEEHDLHLYSNRAKGQELSFGDSEFHRDLVAGELGL